MHVRDCKTHAGYAPDTSRGALRALALPSKSAAERNARATQGAPGTNDVRHPLERLRKATDFETETGMKLPHSGSDAFNHGRFPNCRDTRYLRAAGRSATPSASTATARRRSSTTTCSAPARPCSRIGYECQIHAVIDGRWCMTRVAQAIGPGFLTIRHHRRSGQAQIGVIECIRN